MVSVQERTWRQGTAPFQLKDYRGHQGCLGGTYLAWQLPNSYLGNHSLRPKGRQKRINRELVDLFMKGVSWNGKSVFEKRYCPDGKLAAKAYNRCPDRDIFWHG